MSIGKPQTKQDRYLEECHKLLETFAQDMDLTANLPSLVDQQRKLYREHAAWLRNFIRTQKEGL